jgi:hypothetical protein
VILPNTRLERAWGIDVFNGTEQELILGEEGANTELHAIAARRTIAGAVPGSTDGQPLSR